MLTIVFFVRHITTDFSMPLYHNKENKVKKQVKKQQVKKQEEVKEIKEPKTKLGDIYHLGEHRIICGDSTNVEYYKKVLDGQKIDLVVTDPPYNIDYGNSEQDRAKARGKTIENRSILNDNMDDESFYKFLFKFYETAYAITKGGGVIYVFHSTKESVNFIEAMKDAGYKVSQTLVWAKDHFTLGRNDYQWQHEPILYGWKVEDGKPHYFIHDRTMSTVIEEPRDISKMKA